MSYELIDNIDEKYPEEHFSRDSVIKSRIAEIMLKLKSIIIEIKNDVSVLQTKGTALVSRLDDFEARIAALENP